MINCVYRLAGSVLRLIYRYRVFGLERLPAGGCVVCANHTANIDSALLLLAMDTTDFLAIAKAELFQNKLVAAILRKLHVVPVRRGENDLAAVRAALAALQNGKKVMLFPEGTRVTDGQLVEGKTGAAMLAVHAGVPIVPAYITAGKKAFRRCRIVFGQALEPIRSREHDAYRAMTDQVMSEIRRLGSEAVEG